MKPISKPQESDFPNKSADKRNVRKGTDSVIREKCKLAHFLGRKINLCKKSEKKFDKVPYIQIKMNHSPPSPRSTLPTFLRQLNVNVN